MINLKKIAASIVLVSCISFSIFSESNATAAFVEGCQSYSRGEWENAIFSLRKAIAYSDASEPDVYYMLISSEMYNLDYSSALNDCDVFLESFPTSIYYPRIQYFKGKNLFLLGDFERSIIELSDYCHLNQTDDLYPYALFYIAESLYSAYKYDDAAAIYERILEEFPDCERVSAAQYRLDSILQRSREEKLLYLLKQTGEEYLSAKEEYEKQLRMYNSDTVITARQKLTEAQQKNEELENQIRDLELQISALRDEVAAETAKNEKIMKDHEAEIQLLNKSPEPEPQVTAKPEEKKVDKTAEERREQLKQLREKALEAQRRFEEQQTDDIKSVY